MSRNHFRMISKPEIGKRSVFVQSLALLEPYQLTGRKTPSYVLFQSIYLKERLNLGKPAFSGSSSYLFQPVMSRAALFVHVSTSHVQSGLVRMCSNQSCPEQHCSYLFQPVMSRAALFVPVPTSHVHSGIVRTCSNQSCPQRHCSYLFQPVMSTGALFVRVATSHVHNAIVRTCSNQSCPQRHCSYVFQPVMSTAALFCFRIYFSLFGS